MESTEVKNKLIQKIQETNDQKLLEALCAVLESDTEPLVLNDEQIEYVRQGREDVASGRTVANAELFTEIEEWLKER